MDVNQNWAPQDYEKFVAYLQSLQDEEYQKFNQKLIPNTKPMIGIRIPQLRKLAKELAKGNWRQYLQVAQDSYFEEIMLQGFVLGQAKAECAELLPLIAQFVPKIDNWAVCDCFCSGLKITASYPHEFFTFLQTYLKSEQEFEVRFAVVLLMDYYCNETYINKILEIFDKIRQDGYYVKMAVAWALSVCFVKFEKQTMQYLRHNNLDNFTYNKALQKITESYRVNQDTKVLIRKMKRK